MSEGSYDPAAEAEFVEAKLEQSRVRSAYQVVFHADGGEVVLEDLARFCHVHDSTHVPSHQDPSGRDSAFHEGMRRVYLRIAAFMKEDPV